MAELMDAQTVRVVDADDLGEPQDSRGETDLSDLQGTRSVSFYEDGEPIQPHAIGGRDTSRFLDAVADEMPHDFELGEMRLLDSLQNSADVDFGALLVFPDETLLFVGSDPTAKDSVPLFAYAVGLHEPIPAPETADEALSLLRPPSVQQSVQNDGYLPTRQGEWFLLPTRKVPVSDTFKPGVASRPYGPSPLGSHVPREYAFTVSGSEFVREFHNEVEHAPTPLQSVPEVMDWTYRQLQKNPVPSHAPEWDTIQSLAGDVLIRGTLRHREDDHFVENVGEKWHVAETHNMDVWTGDEMIDRVQID